MYTFPQIYDTVYDGPPAFIAAQACFLAQAFGRAPAPLLDAGCGTGRHIQSLGTLGYAVTGLDVSPGMLEVAHRRLPQAALVLGDLRSLPLATACFAGVLCLESPLAYLLGDDELAAALAGLRRALQPGGRLVVDVFDYAGTLGPDGVGPHTARFPAPWGSIEVTEDHRCDPAAGVWRMRQVFAVQAAGASRRFEVEHVFALRSADDYAAALESAGFAILDARTCYPNSPLEVAGEQRFIFTCV